LWNENDIKIRNYSGKTSENDRELLQTKTRKPSYRWQKPAQRERMPKIAPIPRAYNVVADNTGLYSFV